MSKWAVAIPANVLGEAKLESKRDVPAEGTAAAGRTRGAFGPQAQEQPDLPAAGEPALGIRGQEVVNSRVQGLGSPSAALVYLHF